jgi:hypothetical protein
MKAIAKMPIMEISLISNSNSEIDSLLSSFLAKFFSKKKNVIYNDCLAIKRDSFGKRMPLKCE